MTNEFVLSIISLACKKCARVAQLVEHDLAKVGAAGSSPVSRSHRNTKKVSMWIPFFVFFEPNRGSKVRVTSFASLIGSDPPVSRRMMVRVTGSRVPRRGRPSRLAFSISTKLKVGFFMYLNASFLLKSID